MQPLSEDIIDELEEIVEAIGDGVLSYTTKGCHIGKAHSFFGWVALLDYANYASFPAILRTDLTESHLNQLKSFYAQSNTDNAEDYARVKYGLTKAEINTISKYADIFDLFNMVLFFRSGNRIQDERIIN